MTQIYHAEIHVREGDKTKFEADSIESALSQVIDWAMDDWRKTGCEVNVHVWLEDEDGDIVEEMKDIIEIPSDTEEKDDDEVIAECEYENSTHQIVLIENEAYYMHSYQKHPVELTRRITRSEARALMLDWGYSPAKVAKVTRHID